MAATETNWGWKSLDISFNGIRVSENVYVDTKIMTLSEIEAEILKTLYFGSAILKKWLPLIPTEAGSR